MAQQLKEMVKIVDNKKKHPEERQYLICIAGKSEDFWNIITGRTEAYEFIKENIDDIDLEHSFILVETCTLSERKSIPEFMRYAGEFYNDGFDINDYIKGDWDEEDYRKNNDITQIIDNVERLELEDIMNGNVDTVALD